MWTFASNQPNNAPFFGKIWKAFLAQWRHQIDSDPIGLGEVPDAHFVYCICYYMLGFNLLILEYYWNKRASQETKSSLVELLMLRSRTCIPSTQRFLVTMAGFDVGEFILLGWSLRHSTALTINICNGIQHEAKQLYEEKQHIGPVLQWEIIQLRVHKDAMSVVSVLNFRRNLLPLKLETIWWATIPASFACKTTWWILMTHDPCQRFMKILKCIRNSTESWCHKLDTMSPNSTEIHPGLPSIIQVITFGVSQVSIFTKGQQAPVARRSMFW